MKYKNDVFLSYQIVRLCQEGKQEVFSEKTLKNMNIS